MLKVIPQTAYELFLRRQECWAVWAKENSPLTDPEPRKLPAKREI